MKHALIVGVPERAKTGELEPVASSTAMAALLRDLGGWSVTECTGGDATRSRVREALNAMVSACMPGDACLFYFFGHGGVVKFSDLRSDLGNRAVFYLATLRPFGSRQRTGLLDVELSDTLTRLDQICANVTAIIDCCHAAEMARDDWVPTVPPPPWVVEVDERYDGRDATPLLLAAEGHPRVVRLFGSSSLRHAYATRTPEGLYGLLTQSFVETIRECGLRCDRLTWDAVAHRARERASHRRGMEEQRVVLAGPRHRLLFSTATAPVPRSAAFIPADAPGRGWIRAGLLQGVREGDRWGLAALELDETLHHRFLTEAEVVRVELDNCEVQLSETSLRPAIGTSAIMRKVDERIPVVVEDVGRFDTLARALEGSGIVRPTSSPSVDAVAALRPSAHTTEDIDVLDGDGQPVWLDVPNAKSQLEAVVQLLEDRGRTRLLQRSLAMASPSASTDTELTWRWGVVGPHEESVELPIVPPNTGAPPRIRCGDRLWVQIQHRASTPRQWFVSVLQIGIEGRLSLLNSHQPDGMELRPGVTCYVGRRAHRHRQGLLSRWPSRVPTDLPRAQQLIILASRRPIAMGHLVPPPSPDDPTAFAAQGLNFTPTSHSRSAAHRPFVASEQWTLGHIEFELDPRPAEATE